MKGRNSLLSDDVDLRKPGRGGVEHGIGGVEPDYNAIN